LNPNLYFINPFQTIEGNAFLQPSFTTNVEFSYAAGGLSASLYYNQSESLFSQLPLPNAATNIIRFTMENYLDGRNIGGSIYYSTSLLKRWNNTFTVNVNQAISQFTLDIGQEQLKGVNARFFTSNNLRLNEQGTLLFGLQFWYAPPSIDGVFNKLSASSLDLSLQCFLLERSLRLSLRANDVLRSAADRSTATVNGIFQEARYYYDNQSVYLSVSYQFGNKDIQVRGRKQGNTEERNRLGG
ncbi:MAG: outer membrane beta-barrel protein, partial [Bacteroidota bacterium]